MIAATTIRADEIRQGDSIAFPARRFPWKVLEVRHITADSTIVFLTVRTPWRQRVISFPHTAMVPVIQEQQETT